MKKLCLFLAFAIILSVSSFAMESPAHPVIYDKKDYEKNEITAEDVKKVDDYLTENIDIDSMAGWYFTVNNCLLVYSVDEDAARKVVEGYPGENPFNVLYFKSDYSYGELIPVIEDVERLSTEFLGEENKNYKGRPEEPYMITYVTQYGIEIQLNGNCDNSEIISWYRGYEHRDMVTLKLKYPMWNPA